MNVKERIMAVLRHEEPDVVPVTVVSFFMPRGRVERELRNMGLGLVELAVPLYGIKTPNVTVQTSEPVAPLSIEDRLIHLAKQKRTIHRTYSTPVGSVSEKYKLGYAVTEWPLEWPIKHLQDYETVKSIIDDMEYFPNYDHFLKVDEIMGDDGIIAPLTPLSPLQLMLYELMGCKRFALDYSMHKQEFEQLYRLLFKKQLQMYRIVAESPADIICVGDNIDGLVTNPVLFEKYCMPFYHEVAAILHKKSKIFMSHFDGKLSSLRDLIAKTDIDLIDGFTPPPIGDLPIEEARIAWRHKAISVNPITVYLESGLEGVEKDTIRMLKSAAPGNDFLVGIADDIGDIWSVHYGQVLRAITATVMKHGAYPIASL